MEGQSIWWHFPYLQGRAGSDSGPRCGKKQPLIPNHTLSTAELPPCQFSVRAQYCLKHEAQREPWSSPSSRPVSDTPYKQSEAQTSLQPLRRVHPTEQPRLWSSGTGHPPSPLSPNIHRDPEPSFPTHLLTPCDGTQQRTPSPSPTIAPRIALCGSIPARYVPTLINHITPCHATSPHAPKSHSWCPLKTRAAHFSYFPGDLL